jgi:hypothetical protein
MESIYSGLDGSGESGKKHIFVTVTSGVFKKKGSEELGI